jgi:ABC-type nickel/cobalt efflux system permease component RcnA
MKKFRRAVTIALTLLACFAFVPAAFAHPLGNFTVNQYAGLQISREAVVLDYVLDMAEIPAFQEISTFDANGDGRAEPAEATGYHATKCASLQPDLGLLLNEKALVFTLADSSVEFPVGVGGLPTLRLTCEFRAVLDAQVETFRLSFSNHAFPDRLGWKEIVVISENVTIQGDFSSISSSNRLTNYPQDLLTSPLEQRQVELEIVPAGVRSPKQPAVSVEQGKSPLADRNDAFTRLILLEEINFSTVLLAIVISFIWGAMHAMTPGHGKTVVGAYLVGSRGTLKHAVYLGLTTTITHTLGVFAFGLITLFAAKFILPEQLYPWMSLLSGLFVIGIGFKLLVSRFRSSGINLLAPKTIPVRQLTYAVETGDMHRYVLSSAHDHIHAHGHSHSHGDHEHHPDHNHADHSHLPPGMDGSPVTWRSLLALGVSGGLLPCPSALVVLLGAIALNRVGFGLLLVLAFSLGLAGALTAIGMLFIYAGRLFQRFPAQGGVGTRYIVSLLPVVSALFVSVIGVGIVMKALMEMGIV